MSVHFGTENKHHHWTQQCLIAPILTRFMLVKDHLADFETLSKRLIAPEENKLASSTWHILIEDPLAYLAMV